MDPGVGSVRLMGEAVGPHQGGSEVKAAEVVANGRVFA